MLAAVLWAISGSASKFLFHSGLSPFQLVQLRTTIAGVALCISLLLRNPSLLRIQRKDIPYFLLLGISLASVQSTYLFTISRLPVAAAILLEYQAPVFVVLYLIFFRRKKLGALTAVAMIGALSGCYLVVGAYSFDVFSMNRTGIISGLASAVAFAWYSVHSEYGMRHYLPWTVLFYALLFAAVFWNVFHPPLEAFRHSYSAVEWWWIFFICIIGTILPFGFYNKGIHLIGATHASITATLEPIIAAFLSYLFLSETLESWQVIGGLLVIVSIIMLQMRYQPA
jgi:drug/metabolite transporter (DMT)-like permease